MTLRISILHDSDTEMGRVMLRRRWSLALECDVFEMTVDGKLMMSSAVVESEQALADRALARVSSDELKVLVGGLGFGFTILAALTDARVRELTVVERLGLVIEWHRTRLLPWSDELMSDSRVKVLNDDFFAFVGDPSGSRYDAILIDIDDSPQLLWFNSHAAFYKSKGLMAIRDRLAPGGVLALWSATHPGTAFVATAHATFAATELVEIDFENPCVRQAETNYIFLATAHGEEKQCEGRDNPIA